jgi:hypothetical protein
MFDTSVKVPKREILGTVIGGGRINNVGLMKDQQNGIIVGFGVAAIGAVLMLIKGSGIASDEMQCPYCAETIKAAAKVCRYCQKEL